MPPAVPVSLPRRSLAALAVAATAAACLTAIPDHRAHAAVPLQQVASVTDAKRPNILVITADDMSITDLPYMPHVQRLLVDRGVTLSDAVAPTPLCVPSRVSLLTGQYANNDGVLANTGPRGGWLHFDETHTLATSLHRAGYDTLFAGKYVNGYGDPGTGSARYIPPGWTDWRASTDGTSYNFLRPTLNINGGVRRFDRYTTYVMRDEGNKMLSSPRRRRKPWFMWLSYVAPHSSPGPRDAATRRDPLARPNPFPTTIAAPRDATRFTRLRLPRRADMFRSATGVPSRSPVERAAIDGRGRKALRRVFALRIQALQAVDRAVASQIRTLRRTHQLRNTVVVFQSDNGFMTGEHDLYGKLWQYTESIRIPMVIRGPGIPKGKVVDTAVTVPDETATFVALAGAKPPHPEDGDNVLPLLRGSTRWRVVPIGGWQKVDNRNLYRGILFGPWTYVRYPHGGQEVYDRDTDPYELHSLADDPAYAAQVAALRSLYHQYVDCAGPTCPHQTYEPGQDPVTLAGASPDSTELLPTRPGRSETQRKPRFAAPESGGLLDRAATR